jgi:signal transduction histidine kinase
MLYEYVAAFTKRLFYREGYDYKSTVQQITHYINQAIDIDTLASTSIQRLREVLLIDDFCLLLQTVDGVQVFSSSSTVADYRGILNTNEELWLLIEEISAPVDLYKLEDFLSDIQHSSLKEKIPNYNSIVFWMPILANGESHGLLGIGRKLGRDIPNRYDREILETVNRHFALRFSNLRLIDELKHRTYETIQLHHQALNAREEERKRVARELHDQIIQSLVGLNYHLSQFRNNLPSEEKVSLEKVQYEVRAIISDLRRICIDLRPPALDNLGLIAAVRSRLSEIEQQSSFQINLEIEGETNYEIPEQIALCTYRTLQEVLINIKKHALANQVDIRLYFTEQEIKLSVRDDGCGFVVPPYLGRLIKEGHFGLIGLREHVETLNGTLVINSQLGLGTSIDVVLPTAKLVKPAQILG